MFKSYQSNIHANYTIAPRETCTAGAWQVYAATHKKSAKVVSVFVFDRKTLDSGDYDSRASAQKRVHATVIERLKKEASSLARLRHPSILELAEPVEETRSGLIFATEPVSATLSGLLADKDDEEATGNQSYKRKGPGTSGVELDELEIQKGLQQVANGLEFLHESAGLVHANLTPDAIYINGKSDWKIAGLGFAGPPDGGESKPGAGPPIALSELLYNDPRLPPSVQLNMDYASPDFVMDSTVSSSADMFSLGLIMIALYNSPHRSPVKTHGNTSTYKKIFSTASSAPTASNNFLSAKPLPNQLKTQVLPRLITRRAAQRTNAREFQQSAFFDNVLVSTLQFLDTLPAKTPNEKSQFMRGLPRILDQFPQSVLEKKLLPGLLDETKDKDLLALILGNVFKILKLLKAGQRSFTDRVVPKLREIFLSGVKGERDSQKEAGLIIFLDNLALIAANCDGKVFKDDILPIYGQALLSPTSAVIDKALECLPIVLPKLDFSTIKNELFPVIATVFAKTSSLMIKVRGLDALNTLCGGKDSASGRKNSSSILDKYTVQEKVVPLVKAIKTKEPAVMMAALGLFTSMADICDYDFLATSVLPILFNFSLGPLLDLAQFTRFMDLIQSITARIQSEHNRKLSELASTSRDPSNGNNPSTSGDLMSSSATDDLFGPGPSAAPADDFESLVLGKKAGPPPSDSWDLSSRPAAQVQPKPAPAPAGSQLAWQNSVLQPSQASSRAITPDSTLSSFPTMQPMQPQRATSGLQQPLQASSPGAGSMSPPITSLGLSAGQLGGGGSSSNSIDWGAAQQSRFTNLQTTSYLSSPPQIQQPPLQSRQSSGFSVQAPPGYKPNGMQTQTQTQAQAPKKSGLDQYESLI